MKRSEIKAGEAYYYDRSTNWADGSSRGEKAVVVDEQRYSISRETWGSRRGEARYHLNPKGAAVLVDIYRRWSAGERVEREAVPAAHLRGPYDQTKAEVDARIAARIQNERAAQDLRTRLQELAESASTDAAAIGVRARWSWNDEGYVTVPAEQLAAMVAALAGVGWHYGNKSED